MNRKHRQSGLTIVFACLCAGPSARAVCTGPPALEANLQAHPSAQTYSALGSWFGEKSQYDCAIDTLQAGLRLAPNSVPLNYYLGLSLFSAGRAEEAIAPIERTSSFDTKALQPHLILATIFDQLHREEDARSQWQSALRLDPASKAALDGLSKSFNADGNYNATIRLLHSAKLDEELALTLAWACDKTGKLELAGTTLNTALRAAPFSPRLTDALARVYVEQQRQDAASELLKKFLRVHPNDLEGQRIILPLLVLDGQFAAAHPMAVKLLAVYPHNFDILLLNGILEHQSANYSSARKHLEEAVSLNPEDSSARYYLGLTLEGLADNEGAREQLAKAVALSPSNREAHFELASVLRALGEKKLAMDESKTAQDLFEAKTQKTMAKSKAIVAEKKLDNGDIPGAIAAFREALEIAPHEAPIAYRLAIALDRSGDTAGERAALQIALDADPGMALAQNQMGYLISRDGDATGAEEHFRLALKTAPEYTEAWINLAAALAMSSHFSDAQRALDQALELEPGNARAMGLRKDMAATQSAR